MNNYKAIGRVVRPPELRSFADGTPMCKLRIAVDGLARGEVGFIGATTFEANAQKAARILSTGWLVAVDGCLQYSNWETEDGTKRRDWEVVGQVEFLAAPRGRGEPSDTEPEEDFAAA